MDCLFQELLRAAALRPVQRKALLGLRKLGLLNLGQLQARRERLMRVLQSYSMVCTPNAREILVCRSWAC